MTISRIGFLLNLPDATPWLPSHKIFRPQKCGAVAHTLPATGRVQNNPRLSRLYNRFYLQTDRSSTNAERAADRTASPRRSPDAIWSRSWSRILSRFLRLTHTGDSVISFGVALRVTRYRGGDVERTQRDRTRWQACRSSRSWLFSWTNRRFGRNAASAIASASL
jgi:hypothetical protein